MTESIRTPNRSMPISSTRSALCRRASPINLGVLPQDRPTRFMGLGRCIVADPG